MFGKKDKPCQACGNQTSPADPPVKTRRGHTVHQSHTTNPGSGLYGDRKPSIFRRGN